MTRHLCIAVVVMAFLLSPTDAARRRPPPFSGPAPASIRGTVRSGARPVPNVVVRLQNQGRSTHTNRSGRFAFNNLRPGTYTLFARTRHHGSARATVRLGPNQSTDVTLRLLLPRRR